MVGGMRRVLATAWLLAVPTLASADQSIAGQWQADLGHNVMIAMDVLADGHWASETVQSNKVVAQMAGTYDQRKQGETTGTLVFTPVKSSTSAEHGKAQVETDRYALEQNGRVLRLTTGKDAMVFHKQAPKQ
jgi:hypothetical protein